MDNDKLEVSGAAVSGFNEGVGGGIAVEQKTQKFPLKPKEQLISVDKKDNFPSASLRQPEAPTNSTLKTAAELAIEGRTYLDNRRQQKLEDYSANISKEAKEGELTESESGDKVLSYLDNREKEVREQLEKNRNYVQRIRQAEQSKKENQDNLINSHKRLQQWRGKLARLLNPPNVNFQTSDFDKLQREYNRIAQAKSLYEQGYTVEAAAYISDEIGHNYYSAKAMWGKEDSAQICNELMSEAYIASQVLEKIQPENGAEWKKLINAWFNKD